jgi:hypothetical protein
VPTSSFPASLASDANSLMPQTVVRPTDNADQPST